MLTFIRRVATVEALRADILDMVKADFYSLYEVFWELDDGEVRDADFGMATCASRSDVRDFVATLVKEGSVRVVRLDGNIEVSLSEGGIETLLDKRSLLPFDRGSDVGHALI